MPDQGIQHKLASYSSSARSLISVKGSRKARNWGIYAAATGSALAMSTAADANIIYSGPQNITAKVGTYNYSHGLKTFSINGARFSIAVFKRSFRVSYTGIPFSIKQGWAILWGYGGGQRFADHGSHYGLRRFFSGNTISSHVGQFRRYRGILREVISSTYGDARGHHSFNTGSWIAGKTNFAGILVGGDYGWVRLRFDDANDVPASITAIDWAYDDSGAPIIAGDTGAPASTPEPGSLSLLTLAAGATGIVALRRRRKARTLRRSRPSATQEPPSK
jgi:hypothetical protein